MDKELKSYIDKRLLDFGIPMFNSSGVLIGVVKRLRSSTNITFTRDGLDGLISGLGGSANAPIDAQYLTLAADATLTVERIFTPGNGLTASDGGAGAAYGLALGPLTALWAQTGVFDIEHAGNLRMAKYARIGSIVVPAVTTAGALTVTKLVINNDANYNFSVLVGSPAVIFDGGDSLAYVRADNEFQYVIGSVGAASFRTAALWHGGGLSVEDTGGGSYIAPATSSLVDFSSTTKGFLLPRMTTTQRDAIGTPATGLLIYNTTTGEYNRYSGAAWVAVGSSALLDGALHSDTVAQAVSRGSLIYGNSTPKWDELVLGAANKVPTSDGTDLAYQYPVFVASATIEAPTSSENIGIRCLVDGYTVTKVRVVLVGSATPSVTYNLKYGTDRSAAGTKVWTVDKTTTGVTTGDTFTTFDNAAVTADAWLWFISTAKSGTVTQIEISIEYRRT